MLIKRVLAPVYFKDKSITALQRQSMLTKRLQMLLLPSTIQKLMSSSLTPALATEVCMILQYLQGARLMILLLTKIQMFPGQPLFQYLILQTSWNWLLLLLQLHNASPKKIIEAFVNMFVKYQVHRNKKSFSV